jgi:flavin-dependent dehydrogenase
MDRRDVVIVGSGPRGDRLRLAALAPDVAARASSPKAHHPREKTCAGGVIPRAVRLLAELGVPLSVPPARVDHAGVRVPGRALTVDGGDLCRVVRRCELDARLAWAARDRGVELREGERVVHVARDGAGVRVETDRRAYWAPVVVGADGSGSAVRRALVGDGTAPVARAVMCDVPVADTRWDGFAARRYDFDFAACATGLRGYRWAFPCLIDGVPHVNAGVYARRRSTAPARAELVTTLARSARAQYGWKAFPIRTYQRASDRGATRTRRRRGRRRSAHGRGHPFALSTDARRAGDRSATRRATGGSPTNARGRRGARPTPSPGARRAA